MTLIKSCEIHHTVYYKVCSECLHELAKAEKDEKKAESKREKQLAKAKLLKSQPKQAVKKVSDKRKELNHVYNDLAKQFKLDNPTCAVRINGCTGSSEDVHHRKGRNKYLLDVSTWIAVCRNCHIYIENHPEESKEKGWSESRLGFIEPHAI